jgi:hypothetical protein
MGSLSLCCLSQCTFFQSNLLGYARGSENPGAGRRAEGAMTIGERERREARESFMKWFESQYLQTLCWSSTDPDWCYCMSPGLDPQILWEAWQSATRETKPLKQKLDALDSAVRIYRHAVHSPVCNCKACVELLKALVR